MGINEKNERHIGQKDSIYRVVITEITESGEEKELLDDKFSSIDMVADNVSEKNMMCEIMLNDNIAGAANKLANARKLRSAVRLAGLFMSMNDDKSSAMEGLLADAIAASTEGGEQ